VKKISAIYNQLENFIVYALLTILILLSFAQVAGRLLFNKGLPDADPIIYHLVLWLALLGAVLATREKQHITIDIVSRFVSGSFLNIIQLITGVFTSGVCGILAFIAIRFLKDEMKYNSMKIIGLPIWVFQIIIPLSFALMCIRFSINTSEIFLKLFQSHQPDSMVEKK